VLLRAYKLVRSLNVRFDKRGFVSEVIDNSLLLAKPRLLTNLLIDSTGTKDTDKAKDQELAKDQDLAKAAKIAKKPPLTAVNINLLANTNSTTEQILDQSTTTLPDLVAVKRS
jgi:hypothetical protein